ncbi:hypothetical protein H2201_003773 [Coniosporium apollinis]|uniref:Uncharacterized protein n=1 Tax=Coniosporium apollinis TaxID=61459 RepID=A0ABQ9NUN0_9PEZI|nr:hypothetical protein H2201_003773 [Coniosporium apollinis]
MRLVGTEGENPYVGAVRQSQIKQLRAHNYQGSEDEWKTILEKCLLHKPSTGDDANALEGLEMVASVGEDNQVHLTLRKNISGITQRLGAISLRLEEEEAIELFNWTVAAAQSASRAQDEVADLKVQLNAQQDIVNKLNAQLQDLIQAKQDHENALLEKFKDLLNAKKLKIRDQQRLLARAKVTPAAAAEVQQPKETSKGRKAGPSRTSKRKAKEKPTAAVSESEDDKMRIEEEHAEETREEEAMPEAVTPDRTETETEDEDGFAAPPASQPSQSATAGVGSKGKAIEVAVTKEKEQATPELPPPRRALPFANKKLQKQPDKAAQPAPQAPQAPQATIADDEETDDEL